MGGEIALRSLVNGGKLAAHDNNDDKAVQSAGISAVNKLLGAMEDIIKKTVKNVLEKVKQEVDKARTSKPAFSESSQYSVDSYLKKSFKGNTSLVLYEETEKMFSF